MRKFDFRPARLLRMREATVRAEQSILDAARARRAELEAELEALKDSAANAGRAAKAETWVRPAELANIDSYTARINREIKEWTARVAAQNEAVRKQELVLVEARRNVRLLEILRDQRRAEWQAEADREAERFTEDFIAAQSARARREAE